MIRFDSDILEELADNIYFELIILFTQEPEQTSFDLNSLWYSLPDLTEKLEELSIKDPIQVQEQVFTILESKLKKLYPSKNIDISNNILSIQD